MACSERIHSGRLFTYTQHAPSMPHKDRIYEVILWHRGASSGSIKSIPASVRQPLGFRTMYSSMHGEQIELSQADAGTRSASASNTAAAWPAAKAVELPEARQPQVSGFRTYNRNIHWCTVLILVHPQSHKQQQL